MGGRAGGKEKESEGWDKGQGGRRGGEDRSEGGESC